MRLDARQLQQLAHLRRFKIRDADVRLGGRVGMRIIPLCAATEATWASGPDAGLEERVVALAELLQIPNCLPAARQLALAIERFQRAPAAVPAAAVEARVWPCRVP